MGDVYMVNGKILSGLPNHAKDIIFDNDGTPLSSTNTEDAIKEVDSNLSQVGDCTLLAEVSTTTSSVLLNDSLTNYRMIALYLQVGTNLINGVPISVSLFKTSKSLQSDFYVNSNNTRNYAIASYVDDTHANVTIGGTAHAVLYGIK